MSDVFISYARSTEPRAEAVAQALRAMGYGVWRDEDLPAHRAYAGVIEERLAAAKAVVVLWSADAVQSEWVQSEADRGREDHKLVQARIDAARLPMPFDRIHCVDLSNWTGDPRAPAWRKLTDSIADLVGGAKPQAADAATLYAKTAREPLLAVLAFDNLTGDADAAYFSDGVSDEILQTVARAPNLKVIARSSSFQFRGPDKAVRRIMDDLKATHLLDGSVRRAGSHVRISAQLVDCASQTMLWSDRFDRELTDVLAVQDEIAAKVAAALQVVFAPSAPARSVDPAAYDLFLQAQARRIHGLDEALETIGMLEQVVALAPNFARAWGALATVGANVLRAAGADAERRGLSRARVMAAADNALALDPSQGAPYAAKALLLPFGRYLEREAIHRQALVAAPNDPETLTWMARFCADVGRFHDAVDYAKRAYELDPLLPSAARYYGIYLKDYGLARDLWKSFCARWPDDELIITNAMIAAAAHADWERWDELLPRVHRTDETFRAIIWHARNLRHPDEQSITRWVDRVREQIARTGTVPLNWPTGAYQHGRTEEAFELIEQASFDHMFEDTGPLPAGGILASNLFNPEVAPMRRDVRFVRFCAKLGLCSYWAATGKWPDCADDVPYDFRAEARRLAAIA